MLFSGCLSVSGPSGSSEENVVDPGIIERADGKTETYNPPNNTASNRLDDSFLDQYFSNKGMCEVKLYSCPTGYVQIPDGTDGSFPFTFFELSHGNCIKKGYEYRESCGITSNVVVSFSSPYDTVVSTTVVDGVDRFANQVYTCEMEFSQCLTGGSYAKFDMAGMDKDEAVNGCIDFVSERSIGCQGGVLRQFKVFNDFGFNLTHNNHDNQNHQVLNTCSNSNETVEFVVDFARTEAPTTFHPGWELGLDFFNDSNRIGDASSSQFFDFAVDPLGMQFYRTYAEESFTNTNVVTKLDQRSYRLHVVQAGTPKYVIPIGSDSGDDLANGMPEYEFDTGANKAYDRLLNGVNGKGGILRNIQNMKEPSKFPADAQFVIEPWDAPDYLLQDNYSTAGICFSENANCDYFYMNADDGDEGDGDDTPNLIPWVTGLLMNVSNAPADKLNDYIYSSFEVYAKIIQLILADNHFENVDFGGPSLFRFNKTHMKNFMDYCLNKKLKIQATDGSNRGCEVNYVTWHGGDYYEDQISQLIRDINWVRKTFIEDSTYDPLNIKGIVIVGFQGKRDFFVPAAALRHMIMLEKSGIEHTGRSCWFKSCDDDNSLGGLINFDSSGSTIASSYSRSNMWWTYKFFNESKINRVRSYGLDEKSFILSSARGIDDYPEMWVGTHKRDNKKRNYRILLRNLNRTIFFDDDDLNLRIRKRVLPAEYFNFWNAEDARNYHLNSSNPKRRGPTLNESTDLNYQTVIEYPVENRNVEVCIPDFDDGDVNNLRIDFTPIAQ